MAVASKWKQLNQRKADLVRQCEGILDGATGGSLTAREQQIYDTVNAQITACNRELVEIEAGMERERSEVANGHAPELSVAGALKSRRLARELWPEALSAGNPTGGFPSLGSFIRAVDSGFDPRLIRGNAGVSAGPGGMSEGIPSEGGFLVPVEYSFDLLDGSLESEIVRPRADVRPMTTDTKAIAGFDTQDHTGGQIGGFRVQWLPEAGAAITQKGRVRRIELHARKAAIFTQATNELAADASDFDKQLTNILTAGLGWGLDDSFLNGTGTIMPLGVFMDPALVVVPKETAQTTPTIVTENILNMWSRLHPSCAANSVWVCNPTCLPSIMSIMLGTGSGVTLLYVGDPSGRSFGQLLGRPLLVTEKVPVLGSAGDLLLADFSQYAIGLRKELILQKSIHAGWQTDESGYRVIVRVDGQGKWSQAVKPKNGPTLSWCVTLAKRP